MFSVLLSLLILTFTAHCQLPTAIERKHLLEAHLKVRENVSPPASNMLLMRYSKDLEELASQWISQCVFGHPDPKKHPKFRGIGQSLALVCGFKPHVTECVCGWIRERKFYNFKNNTCRDVCDHYTQLVWARSDQVGCAMKQCDSIRPAFANPQYLIACQYKPGQVAGGSKPYVAGPSCSQCPEGYSCHRKQCVRKYKFENVYPTAGIKVANKTTVPQCLPSSAYTVIDYY